MKSLKIYLINDYTKIIKEDDLVEYDREIDVNSPIFDLLFKEDVFQKFFIIPISKKEIEEYNLKNEYISAFNKLNNLNLNYPLIRLVYNDGEDINILNEFKFNFNLLKSLEIKQEKSCKNYDLFFKTLFSFPNLENSLIFLEVNGPLLGDFNCDNADKKSQSDDNYEEKEDKEENKYSEENREEEKQVEEKLEEEKNGINEGEEENDEEKNEDNENNEEENEDNENNEEESEDFFNRNKLDPNIFEGINNFKSLEELRLNNFEFKKAFILNLPNLKKLLIDQCSNIVFAENSCLKLKELFLYGSSFVQNSKIVMPELEGLTIDKENESFQNNKEYDIFDYKSLQ